MGLIDRRNKIIMHGISLLSMSKFIMLGKVDAEMINSELKLEYSITTADTIISDLQNMQLVGPAPNFEILEQDITKAGKIIWQFYIK